ncbi:MAG TPA: sigma-70 family RNA polymerase sigma factor [Pyrinomonadaceae bacterium]
MPPSKHPSDEELLRLMLAGDESAFVLIYRRWQGGVYRFALQMSGSESAAEDVTQEVFMVLMREANRYDPERGSLAAYLYGIARNYVLRHLHKERNAVQLADEEEDESASILQRLVSADDPLGDLTRSETIESVRIAILGLPAHYREVVVLCELHEMSYAEAAETLGCAVGTIRSRLHRARSLLFDKLREVKNAESPTRNINSARCFA